MLDLYGRKIEYLRLSITDRCNLSCEYCRSHPNWDPIPYSQMLSFEEICDFVKAAAREGINKVRLTGGEPLLRRGVVELVYMLSEIEGLTDLSMTTNGVLLDRFAADLFKAGIKRINISLDTMDPECFRRKNGGDIHDVLRGIEAAISAGMNPVKINCVVDDVEDVKRNFPESPLHVSEFALKRGLMIRYIQRMDLSAGHFSKVHGGDGGNCQQCNRLRLSADGWLRPCLFNDIRFNIRQMGYIEAIKSAISAKPERGTCSSSSMDSIGG